MVVETPPAAELFLIGRVLLGGVLAYLGVTNMLDAGSNIEYARSTGVPFAGIAVPVSFVLLILGGFGILLGVYPMVASIGIIAFFIGVTPVTVVGNTVSLFTLRAGINFQEAGSVS